MTGKRLLLLPIIAIIAFASGISLGINSIPISSPTSGGIHSADQVCITKIDGNTGEIIPLGCNHNLFTTAGQNMTRDYLSTAAAHGDFPQYIAVSNDTPRCGSGACTSTSGANSTNLTYEFVGCGLGRAVATRSVNDTTGAWILTKTFTVSSCTGTVAVNATGLFNSTTAGAAGVSYFAGNNFTDASLTNNDQLNVTWTIQVS